MRTFELGQLRQNLAIVVAATRRANDDNVSLPSSPEHPDGSEFLTPSDWSAADDMILHNADDAAWLPWAEALLRYREQQPQPQQHQKSQS
jgi:hypothetical protein